MNKLISILMFIVIFTICTTLFIMFTSTLLYLLLYNEYNTIQNPPYIKLIIWTIITGYLSYTSIRHRKEIFDI